MSVVVSACVPGLATKKFKLNTETSFSELVDKLRAKFDSAHFDLVSYADQGGNACTIDDDDSLEIALDEVGEARELKLTLTKTDIVYTFSRSTTSKYTPQSERWSNDCDFDQVCRVLNPTSEPPLGVVAVGALVRRGTDWHWGDIDGRDLTLVPLFEPGVVVLRRYWRNRNYHRLP
jgi:hypothetical protein